MVFNPAGLQLLADGGNPRFVTGIARDAISGGYFVFASGGNNVVSSGTNSFVTGDLLFAAAASGASFNGIALNTAGSNSAVTVLTQGLVIVTANNTVTAARKVWCDGADSVANAGSVAANVAALLPVGRAFTSAASGGYCLVEVTL